MRRTTPKQIETIPTVPKFIPTKRLFTLKEAARYLGRCEKSIRTMYFARELPGIQRGDNGKITFDIHDLDAWIEKNKRTA